MRMMTNRLLVGDMPSGDVFHVSADQLPNGGQDAIRRVLFVTSTEEQEKGVTPVNGSRGDCTQGFLRRRRHCLTIHGCGQC